MSAACKVIPVYWTALLLWDNDGILVSILEAEKVGNMLRSFTST